MANPEEFKGVQNGLFTNPFTVSTGVRIPLGTPFQYNRRSHKQRLGIKGPAHPVCAGNRMLHIACSP
jgi:hypothetical protein